jgi:hypothetical protein
VKRRALGGEGTDPATQWQARQLLALAEDVSRYLRHHAAATVRLTAALLLAASLAACNASASDGTMVETRAVAPLTQEVVSGLPRGPGTYPVVHGSVFRDQQGVYRFEWLDPGSPATAPGQLATTSRLRLVGDSQLALEMPESGDPILHLPADEDIGLTQQTQAVAGQPGVGFYPPAYSYWHPFSPGLLVVGRPAYYDPPRTIVVDESSSSTGASGGTSRPALRVEGGTVSDTARPPAARVTGVQSAVSGRAGGTGAGSAVTSRNQTSGAARSAAGASSSSSSGSSSSSSGVSSSGSSGSSSSSSGVSAPRSSGFSAGRGSTGGSAAS